MSSTAQTTSSTRLRRGAVAGGIAVLLLAGGGATWASWNDSSTVAGGQAYTGDQGLAVAGGTWQLCRAADTSANPTYGNCVAVTDLTAVKLVPGDQLQYSATVTPTLVGDNLKATLTSTASTASAVPAPLTLEQPVVAGVTGNLTPANSGISYDAKMSITFPWSAGAADAQNATVNVSNVTFTLTQVL